MQNRPIVTLSLNPVLDESCSVDCVVHEHKLRCSRPIQQPGGGGINVSRAIKELGGDSYAVWTCGGGVGATIADRLSAGGLQNQPISIQQSNCRNLMVLEETTGRRFRFCLQSPRISIAEQNEIRSFLSNLKPAPDYLVVTGTLDPSVANRFYPLVVEAMPDSCRLVFDLGVSSLQTVLESGLYLIKPNRRELEQLCDRTLANLDEVEEAAQWLQRTSGVEVVVASLGADGAVFVTSHGIFRIPSPEVAEESKVGAGDSMVAGLVLGLARDWPLQSAARLGVAAGAAAVMTPHTDLCRRVDVEFLYQYLEETVPLNNDVSG